MKTRLRVPIVLAGQVRLVRQKRTSRPASTDLGRRLDVVPLSSGDTAELTWAVSCACGRGAASTPSGGVVRVESWKGP